MLVVTETWHDGWRATVDGAEAPVLVADHAFLGVPVPTTAAADVRLTFHGF